MTSLLIAVSIVSSALALVMSVLVIRMLREERRRSDARIEALMHLAGESRGESPLAPDDQTWANWEPVRAEAEPPSGVPPATLEPFDGPTGGDASAAAAGTLFSTPAAPSPWGRRLVAAAASAAVLVAIGGSFALRPSRNPAAPQPALPLELMSLHHTADSGSLTVTGLVHNPANARELEGVSAVALAFSDDGTLVGSGRAPLDFTRVRAGDESPFTVRVATPRRISRYRVSFRDNAGAVVAHVDRRTAAEAVARKD